MLKRYFSLCLMIVCFCTSGGAPLCFAQGAEAAAKPSAVEKIKRKVFARGTGAKARVGVNLNDGTKLKGYISEATVDSFTVIRTDEQLGTPVKINYQDVAGLKTHGKGISTASKVLIGVGIGVVLTAGLLVLAFKDGGHSILR